MSEFRDQLDSDFAAIIHGEFAEAEFVTVVDGSGTSAQVKGIFDKTFLEVDPNTATTTVLSRKPRVLVWAADVPFTLKQGHQVTVRGKTYRVRQLEDNGEGSVMLYLD